MKEVVLDTETTGLSVKEGHRIVEIGCIELDNLIPTNNQFHCYLNPDRKVSEKALEIHGYTDEFLSDKKKFIEIVDEFLKFIKDKIDKKNTIDTLEIARDKYPGSGISLDALCKRYRIDNSKREKHTALIDCELLSKVYINLTDQKEPTLNFNPKVENKKVFKTDKIIDYYKKIIIPTSEEFKLHKKYIKNSLKKNNFN